MASYERSAYDIERFSHKPGFIFIDAENRHVAHMSPQVTYNFGISPENGFGGNYPLSFLTSDQAREFQPAPITDADVAEYLKATAESRYWRIEHPDFEEPEAATSWDELDLDFKRQFLTSDQMVADRQIPVIEQACQVLELGLGAE